MSRLPALANLNGQPMPLEEVRVPALDRGFLFGDAVYEVLRVYGGRPWLADEHFARLGRSLDAVRIRGVDLDRLRRRMLETIAAGPFREATSYIQITRGAAPRKHAFPAGVAPLEFLFVQDFADPYAEARRTGAAAITQPASAAACIASTLASRFVDLMSQRPQRTSGWVMTAAPLRRAST